MIVIEPVQQFGQIVRAGVMTPAIEARMRQAQLDVRARDQRIRDAERAREERIRQTEAARAVRPTEPRTPLEVEARRRTTVYRAENKLQSDRRRFEKAVQLIPIKYKRAIRDLVKVYNNYESLPGYSAFSAGRATVAQMLPGIMQAHERLREQQEAARRTSAEAWEAKHDIIEQQIDVEQQMKAEARQERERIAREKARQQAAESGTPTERAQEDRRITIQRAKEAEWAAHQQQPGSPPVSVAISEIAAQYAISPGPMEAAVFRTFTQLVGVRARQLRNELYYYLPPRMTRRKYPVNAKTIAAVLKAEGYTAEEAQPQPKPVQQYPDPRIPGAYSVTAAQQRARQQAARPGPTIVEQPARQPAVRVPADRSTASPDDPMIQAALQEVIGESGLQSGAVIRDIGLFQRLVTQKIKGLERAHGKTARREDITAAVDGRLRFVLNGAAAV